MTHHSSHLYGTLPQFLFNVLLKLALDCYPFVAIYIGRELRAWKKFNMHFTTSSRILVAWVWCYKSLSQVLFHYGHRFYNGACSLYSLVYIDERLLRNISSLNSPFYVVIITCVRLNTRVLLLLLAHPRFIDSTYGSGRFEGIPIH